VHQGAFGVLVFTGAA